MMDGTNVDEQATGTLPQLYPNPCTDHINTVYSFDKEADITIAIIDLYGNTQKIISMGNQAPGIHTTRIDTQTLAAGIYVLHLLSDQKLLGTRKLIRR